MHRVWIVAVLATLSLACGSGDRTVAHGDDADQALETLDVQGTHDGNDASGIEKADDGDISQGDLRDSNGANDHAAQLELGAPEILDEELTSAADADPSVDVTEPQAEISLPPDGDLEISTADDSVEAQETPGPVAVFDLDMIRDATTAECAFTNHKTVWKDGVVLDVWNVSYVSWDAIDGVLVPITIQGFAAKPAGSDEDLPGIIHAHGLGGWSDEDNATGPAALLGMFVIAYTGPGGGVGELELPSEGLGAHHADGYRMFDTIPDPRGSWFWGHAVAAMRGLTCLEARPEVDPEFLGMTGYSAGGVATLMVSGVDARVKASVPLSACGRWDIATEAPHAWQHALLTAAGLDIASPEWATLLQELDPGVLSAQSGAAIMMTNGTSDEFFPLTAHVATYDALSGADKRSSLAGNYDHGCFAVTGVEDAQTIEDRASIRAKGAQRMWLRHWLTDDTDFAYVPEAPVVELVPAGLVSVANVLVDGGGDALSVESVHFWWSSDDAFLWGNVELPYDGGLIQEMVQVPMGANTITFIDVEYKTKALFLPTRFSISSTPVIPEDLVPHIRDMESCL
jgi:cephalosporin-C deacetylase-like acetyl esterase